MNRSSIYVLISLGLFGVLIFNILAPAEYAWLSSGKTWAVFALCIFYGLLAANSDEEGKP